MQPRPLRKQGTQHVGLTYTVGTVEALGGAGTPVEARFLIDTGAIDCLAPASILHSAGIQPVGTALYELADGQTIELTFGRALIRFLNTETIVKIIFGPEGVEPLLGAIALEDAGFTVDPANNTLKHVPLRSLKRVA